MRILVFNAGSSSLKGALWDVGEDELPSKAPDRLWDARVDWGRHQGSADVSVRSVSSNSEKQIAIRKPEDVLKPLVGTLPAGGIDVVGHRIVHGGPQFRDSVRITTDVRDGISGAAEFAPQHNQIEVAIIDGVSDLLRGTPQLAAFDTAFHATLSDAASTYAGPLEWRDRGIRRYGFHGISYSYTSRRVSEILGRDLKSLRMIGCHLGNGCSACAINGGRSIDTTMGFTPLEGLMMGTRSGTVDPAILIYLVRHCGQAPDDLDRVLNKESGLKGVSGISGDMREVMKAKEAGSDRARLAYDIFIHRLCREIGGMIASLGGLDVLYFTGGIGENAPQVREDVCKRLAFLGLKLDTARNAGKHMDQDIAETDSPIRVLAVATDEDWEIARECRRLLI